MNIGNTKAAQPIKSAMIFIAIIVIAFCAFAGLAHPDLVKTLLFLSWVAMAGMATASILYSVGRLLF